MSMWLASLIREPPMSVVLLYQYTKVMPTYGTSVGVPEGVDRLIAIIPATVTATMTKIAARALDRLMAVFSCMSIYHPRSGGFGEAGENGDEELLAYLAG